ECAQIDAGREDVRLVSPLLAAFGELGTDSEYQVALLDDFPLGQLELRSRRGELMEIGSAIIDGDGRGGAQQCHELTRRISRKVGPDDVGPELQPSRASRDHRQEEMPVDQAAPAGPEWRQNDWRGDKDVLRSLSHATIRHGAKPAA